ncbi:DUF2628 domain-containing protein [Paenirhodobacter sp. CAU 1674]|uniref:DUF2628 domain-containing protein n=1 Tax=Paenirhodobacter sp. CAU 1674 TaxID=3032596 RepID=UPI0023DA8492|nr:DUF2628 domain-containing protein [Paenirhodobacter sp. CAU 1674]MDF2140833.1 DUF2628 domain-containing protein [Paenirhodobacter sp. CAU 1674]
MNDTHTTIPRYQRSDADNLASSIATADDLTRRYDESTGLSWLWAFLFGPIYFAVHGFWGRAAIVLILNFFIIGFFVAPFMAYPAWRKRAEERADRAMMTAALLNNAAR